MIPGMNPRQMKQAMKRMGMTQTDIPATEVIIRCADKEIVLPDPQVAKVNMMGQETYQITGDAIERALDTTPDIDNEDIQTVMDQTGADEETVKQKLAETNGDLAEAIMQLKSDEE